MWEYICYWYQTGSTGNVMYPYRLLEVYIPPPRVLNPPAIFDCDDQSQLSCLHKHIQHKRNKTVVRRMDKMCQRVRPGCYCTTPTRRPCRSHTPHSWLIGLEPDEPINIGPDPRRTGACPNDSREPHKGQVAPEHLPTQLYYFLLSSSASSITSTGGYMSPDVRTSSAAPSPRSPQQLTATQQRRWQVRYSLPRTE
jgi:hypothetical protein